MAANFRSVLAASTLSFLSLGSATAFPSYPACKPTTRTVYTTVTVSEDWQATPSTEKTWDVPTANVAGLTQVYTPPADFTFPGVTFPTFSPGHLNPNGPYYNPNNYVPEPFTWPGLPTPGQTVVPDVPSGRPRPAGGYNSAAYSGPAWCLHGSDLKPALSQKDTNGESKWGLIDCPRLPPYAGDHAGDASSTTSAIYSPRPSSVSLPANGTRSASYIGSTTSSWSSSNVPSASASPSPPRCENNVRNACGKMPDTGVVRHYDFDVAYDVSAPDGVKRNVILINKQFPGPLIEANWGDWIEVTVTNSLPFDASDQGEPTAMHWHGFLQQETPYYDGVPSVMQGPIVPGKSVTYKFRADHFGTSWYHSHYSAQYAGGASGPIVIYGPETACYDEDVGPVMLTDWYHKDYFSILEGQYTGVTALSNNALINGKMNYPCDNTTAGCTPNAGVSKFKFTPGKKYRLRLINTSADATMKFNIDGHNFTVFANDFIPVVPYSTGVVTLAVGQRSDVVVEAVGKEGDAFWMRSEMGNFASGNGCSFSTGVSTEAVAAVYYDGADTNALPTTTSSLTDAQKKKCEGDDLSLIHALCPVRLEEDFALMTLDVGAMNNGTHNVMHVNNSSFRANMNVNLLENVIEGNFTFAKEWNVYQLDSSKKAIRMVIRNSHVTHHPMHLHGHNMNILAVGTGEWDGAITNPDSTLVRDVQMLKGTTAGVKTYIVVQFNLDNPGVWPLHCHIAWHVSAGLYVNLIESAEKIDYTIPAELKQTSIDYAAWQQRGNVVNQIDSGL